MKKIVASLMFGVIMLIAFITIAAISRRELPVGLRDVYGDTSSIRSLVIEGEVSSWEGRYAYVFSIGPERSATNMSVFRNSQGVTKFYSRHSPFFSDWYLPMFQLTYLPIGSFEIITAESERSFFSGPDGSFVPAAEYRIYGDVFEVRPMLHYYPLYVPSEQSDTDHGLFMDLGPDGYIYSFHRDAGFLHFTPGVLAPSTSGLRLPNQLSIGDSDIYLFVPTGSGLFGHTAVYAIHMSYISFMQAPQYHFMVNAEVLFPIELERGKDEIIGFIELDSGILLIIKRVDGFELTRICPSSWETQTIFIEGSTNFHNYFLQGDALVLQGFEASGPSHSMIAAIDLREERLVVSGVFPLILGIEEMGTSPGGPTVDIHDMILMDSVVYIAYTVTGSPWHHLYIVGTETFVSAFNNQGQLIGRSQVLNGVEDDKLWAWDFQMQHFHGRNPISQRRVHTVSIRGR